MRNGILVGRRGRPALVRLCVSARARGPISAISGKMTHVAGDLAQDRHRRAGPDAAERDRQGSRRSDRLARKGMPELQERHQAEQSDPSDAPTR